MKNNTIIKTPIRFPKKEKGLKRLKFVWFAFRKLHSQHTHAFKLKSGRYVSCVQYIHDSLLLKTLLSKGYYSH